MKLSIYGRSKETIEDEPDIFTIQQDDKINIWKVSHGNNGSFTAEERERYLDQSIITVHRGFKIGHSYFCNPSTDENWYQSVIEYEINPLIEEYWFDDEEKAQEYMDYLLG